MAAVLFFGLTTLVPGTSSYADILDIDDVWLDVAESAVPFANDVDAGAALDIPTFDLQLDVDAALLSQSLDGSVVDIAVPNLAASAPTDVEEIDSAGDTLALSAEANSRDVVLAELQYYESVLANYYLIRDSLTQAQRDLYDPIYAGIEASNQYLRDYLYGSGGVPGGGNLPGGNLPGVNLPDINTPWSDPVQFHNQVTETIYGFLNDVFITPLYTIGTWISGAASWLQPIGSWAAQTAHNIATSIADSATRFLLWWVGA